MPRPAILATLAISFVGAWLSAAAETSQRSPRINYMLNCQGCHLPTGSGMPGKVPNMRGELAKFLLVDGGRDFIVQVPGTANSKLSDAETAELLNWLVPEMGPRLPTDFKPYTAAEVGRLRAQRLHNVQQVRADLVTRIQQLAK